MARTSDHITRNVLLGALSGAAGTAAMDLLLYARYRRSGGNEPVGKWEFAEGVTNWDQASAPGQLGRKVEQLIARRPPPDSWARSTTNIVHWATGAGWGLQYALVAGRASRRRWLLAAALGPAAWLTSYVVLPLAKVYKPIWEYDAQTLRNDLSAHVVYGIVTAKAFAALAPDVMEG
ncbi:MAG: hypothetical protein ABJD24_04900 [Acidimicrobiales bacterium]